VKEKEKRKTEKEKQKEKEKGEKASKRRKESLKQALRRYRTGNWVKEWFDCFQRELYMSRQW
jgi:hypothetical protein